MTVGAGPNSTSTSPRFVSGACPTWDSSPTLTTSPTPTRSPWSSRFGRHPSPRALSHSTADDDGLCNQSHRPRCHHPLHHLPTPVLCGPSLGHSRPPDGWKGSLERGHVAQSEPGRQLWPGPLSIPLNYAMRRPTSSSRYANNYGIAETKMRWLWTGRTESSSMPQRSTGSSTKAVSIALGVH